MKQLIKYIVFGLFSVSLFSCGLDNYEAPESKLYGQVFYKDASGEKHELHVKGTASSIKASIYQYGYALSNAIEVYLDQDAKFEAILFDGEYHIILNSGNGPWKTVQISEAKKDTVDFNLSGTQTIELFVTPYFLVKNANVSLSGSTISATCDIERIIEDAEVSVAEVFLSTTNFVDEDSNFARYSFEDKTPGAGKSYSVTITDGNVLSSIETAKKRSGKIYGRIGVKANGASQYIYSNVFELSL
ncbi:DUF3823 domain-containing protein [Parabacteroides gordonii]|uniref:DUF3823 domain-containing protein n=1 Tax=Parabacteroides gordonii MS-1 = DSM 23371 TaxID=1203610 RepID=A0A0F5JDA6_9BACT|nr:DUF3823 domain-containing protein [Parabacteroides gordonii]KKB55744.1 hypothetical protein HMPREF1536_03219 [Parabacteroides gordonii MS-1 = DSM 23371]MCA5581473.1 DUF3823 domain-containing protein [Parabacteroides gordonii]RGP18270.1 DUF3823 domain-containing protein [Parabacteroides gordonii]